ncbi:hypothetical protein [Stappia phage SI01]|uniref:Uncharacterized protein n=1 Tax=Stappia phage SI01 TaxID=2847766 RepID=A0AAE7SQP7_9CAUD|nr:hypothetical protein [Stappia phage SI01]
MSENTVSANPARVEFPRDQWGFTSALRKYGLLVASAVRGDEKKLELFLITLGILAQHAQARFPGDVADKNRRLAASGVVRAQAEPVAPVENTVTENKE